MASKEVVRLNLAEYAAPTPNWSELVVIRRKYTLVADQDQRQDESRWLLCRVLGAVLPSAPPCPAGMALVNKLRCRI